MRHITTRTAVAIATGSVLLGVTACGSAEPDPTGTPAAPSASSAAAAPTATTTPTASADALIIPDCEQLVPIAEIQQYESWSMVVLIQSMEQPGLSGRLPGPVAEQTAAGAQQARGCLLGVPQSDSGLGVYTLEITPEARDDLIDELRADGSYSESDIDGAPSFAIATEQGLGGSTVSYTFAGDAWIILNGSLIDTETAARAAAPALAQLRAANPGLDED